MALNDRDWELVCAMVEAVERRWFEPDHGIWEIRDNPRHHVYSKVMGWVTVDRAVALAEHFGRDVEPGWTPLRDKIAEEVREKAGRTRSARSPPPTTAPTSTPPPCTSGCRG